MLIMLALSTFLATPPPEPQLAILAPPTAEGRLRDQVWAAFTPGSNGRWQLERSHETVSHLERVRATFDGAIWASEAADGIIIHRVIFGVGPDQGMHLQDRVQLPADAPAAAVTEAVALRLRFILSAPDAAGQTWQATTPPPPLPAAAPPIPSAHQSDLVTQRAPPVPRRQARVPDPPPPLPAPVILPDEFVGTDGESPPTVYMGIGADGLWSTGGWDAGLQGFAAVGLSPGWAVGLDGAFHPFHDLKRDGRPLGVTGYRTALFADRAVARQPGWRWGVRAGLGISGLSAVGADTQSSAVRPTLTVASPMQFALTGPFALHVDAGLVLTPGATQALYQSQTLVERGTVQVRAGVMLGWAIQ